MMRVYHFLDPLIDISFTEFCSEAGKLISSQLSDECPVESSRLNSSSRSKISWSTSGFSDWKSLIQLYSPYLSKILIAWATSGTAGRAGGAVGGAAHWCQPCRPDMAYGVREGMALGPR